jgi:hypothetical protein
MIPPQGAHTRHRLGFAGIVPLIGTLLVLFLVRNTEAAHRDLVRPI